MVCSCGGRYPDSDEFCPFCNCRNKDYTAPPSGTATEKQEFSEPGFVPCKNCGRTINGSAYKCPICGTLLSDAYSPKFEHAYQSEDAKIQQKHIAVSCANIAIICGVLGLLIAGQIFGFIAIFQGRKAKRLGYSGRRASVAIVFGVIAIAFWLFLMFLVFYYVPRFAPHLIPEINEMFGLR